MPHDEMRERNGCKSVTLRFARDKKEREILGAEAAAAAFVHFLTAFYGVVLKKNFGTLNLCFMGACRCHVEASTPRKAAP
jgi:hypothetical protein